MKALLSRVREFFKRFCAAAAYAPLSPPLPIAMVFYPGHAPAEAAAYCREHGLVVDRITYCPDAKYEPRRLHAGNEILFHLEATRPDGGRHHLYCWVESGGDFARGVNYRSEMKAAEPAYFERVGLPQVEHAPVSPFARCDIYRHLTGRELPGGLASHRGPFTPDELRREAYARHAARPVYEIPATPEDAAMLAEVEATVDALEGTFRVEPVDLTTGDAGHLLT